MRGQISATLKTLAFMLVTVPLMPLQWLLILLWPQMAKLVPYYYHKLLCKILGFKVVIKGTLPTTRQCLFVSNHVSWIDIVVLSAITPLSFVAKREVAMWPFFGWLAKLQGSVFIDREKRHSTKHSGHQLARRLAEGDRLVLFPEGTSHNGQSVLPFKSSFFAAAASPDIAVIPLTLAYTQNWGLPLTRRNRGTFAWFANMNLLPHLWAALCAGPLTVEIIIHPVLEPETSANRKRAAEVSEWTIRHSLAAALHGRAFLE